MECNDDRNGRKQAMTIHDKIAALGPKPVWENYSMANPDNGSAAAAYHFDRAERAEAERDLALQTLRKTVDALIEVGDDYPGSSCQKWCHKEAEDGLAVLAAFGEGK